MNKAVSILGDSVLKFGSTLPLNSLLTPYNCCIFQVSITLGILYWKLGISAVIGGLFVVVCAPLMYFLGVWMSKMQKKVLVSTCCLDQYKLLWFEYTIYKVVLI